MKGRGTNSQILLYPHQKKDKTPISVVNGTLNTERYLFGISIVDENCLGQDISSQKTLDRLSLQGCFNKVSCFYEDIIGEHDCCSIWLQSTPEHEGVFTLTEPVG